ncbi:anthocyanidin 5,3-O-glucosyltransferase-like [Pyrus ussuriensis x Pyrus communis]|uniref:Anthocyanidin 5,3-O-glucosyltransferase-like n=1 Tax=Pyrus ussuriensis x Pyrus communis TaxID=2448454 RepID=A0A5N5HD22_9ROSA|nr:anthocyanidin 5,3-O-glucosyltransferase-like [Pyrus ussuriensis x Pyrus communis]
MPADSGSLLQTPETHVVLLPSSQMGHLTPMLRLAALLLAQNHCPLRLTLITAHPTVSLAESVLISRFLSAYHDRVTHLQFHPLPIDPSTVNSTDPFWIQFEVIRRSAHLLTPLLSTLSPPPSAVIYDISLLSPPLFQYIHRGRSESPETKWGSDFTFEALEAEGLEAISGGSPPVFSVGPFVPCEFEKLPTHGDGDRCGGNPVQPQPLEWFDEQPDGSVVYVAFGSKTALSSEQIREVGDGLEKSGFRFLWVVKEKMVDSEEEGGEGNLVRIEGRGLVVRMWVEQGEILGHRAAAWQGVRVLAWPQNGDHKVVAEVAEIC